MCSAVVKYDVYLWIQSVFRDLITEAYVTKLAWCVFFRVFEIAKSESGSVSLH